MVRSPVNNPFEPGSDRIPTIWAGRQPQLADWRDRLRPRRVSGQYERGRTLLGEPGIGKSVLVRRIAVDAEREHGDWVTRQVRVPRGGNPLALLSEALLDLADAAGLPARREQCIGELLARVRVLTLLGAGVTLDAADAPPAHRTLTALLVELGRRAFAEERVVVIHLDEVQNVTDPDLMSATLVALGDALAHEEPHAAPGGQVTVHLPLVVFLTGLPELRDYGSSLVGATFARRFAPELLDPISDDDLHAALHRFVHHGWPVLADGDPALVTMEPAAAAAIVELSHGDPLLFQLAGQHAWDAGSDARLTAGDVERGWQRARSEARQRVEQQLERLPGNERAMLETMAALDADERTLTTIAKAMGYEQASQAGPTARRLDTVRGLISRGRPYGFRARAVEAYLRGGWP